MTQPAADVRRRATWVDVDDPTRLPCRSSADELAHDQPDPGQRFFELGTRHRRRPVNAGDNVPAVSPAGRTTPAGIAIAYRAAAGIVLYGWVNGSLAAGMIRLDDRFSMGATLVGAHLAAFAIGLLVTGALPRAARVAGAAPLVFATTLVWFLTAPRPLASLAAALVLGASGSLTLGRSQAVLTSPAVAVDPTRALMIANVVAAGTAAAAAASIGLLAPSLTVVTTLPALALGTIALGLPDVGTAPVARSADAAGTPDRRTSPSGPQLIGLVLIASYVAIELTVANQISGFLAAVDVDETVARLAVGVLFTGIVVGRLMVSVTGTERSASTISGAAVMTAISLAITVAAPNDVVVVLSVFVLGVALGPLYPLLVAQLLGGSSIPARTSALSTSAVGLALLVTPPSTGAARDALGDRAGMLVIVAVATIAIVLVMTLNSTGSTSPESSDSTEPNDPGTSTVPLAIDN